MGDGTGVGAERVRYWIGVASRDHVMRGVEGGFAQVGHGKRAPLVRMAAGDWLVYYSSKMRLDGAEQCRVFTALGRIADSEVFQFDMGGGFTPYRRRVEYRPAHDAPILPLLGSLGFIIDKKRWGYPFRAGHLEIGRGDFVAIATAMDAEL
jgi:EVE domain